MSPALVMVWGGGDADSNPALGRCWKGQLQLVLAAATSPRRGTESLLMSLVCDRKIMWRVGVVGWVGERGVGGGGVGWNRHKDICGCSSENTALFYGFLLTRCPLKAALAVANAP